ncbi:MAG TPA: peptide-methionine (S)-S-oxide reductase MsrA, partial [Pseudomonadales bacterium]
MKRHICLPALLISVLAAGSAADEAVFAGGCFWCMEALYQEQEGVTDVVSGFTGGTHPNPTYSGRHDGHYEAVRVTYDPQVISYQDLLDLYWVNVDPFDDAGQFCDKGPSYRGAIFVADDTQRARAEASRVRVAEAFPDQRIVTAILPAATFFPVEDAHQDYYLNNPIRY